MLSKIRSCALIGIDGYIVEVETDISNGLPRLDIVGLGDVAVKESKDRVKAAIKNIGFEYPIRRITINLAPASLKKEGSIFDLPIALGILKSSEQIIDKSFDDYVFIGELALGGEVRAVNGILPTAISARERGIKNIVVPYDNADEAAVVNGINVLPAKNLIDVVRHLNGEKKIEPRVVDIDELFTKNINFDIDFADVKGQENVKRALEVAAAGGHNCLMIGSPGCGKSMLAKRLPTILPPLTFEESLEVTKVYSVAGLLNKKSSLVTNRPFRSPHHTISDVSLIGGGRVPKPGEISLSHFGVLFLDELPEFSKSALEVMRQPLEDGVVNISRVNASITYPAQSTLICAANPCKCGNYLETDKECTCTPRQVTQYLSKFSGPLLDRIDLHIEVSSVKYDELESKKEEETSQEIRERVNRARNIQLERYKKCKIYSNSQLNASQIKKFCNVDEEGKKLLKNAFERLNLSARAHSRILKVARTIADLDESKDIKQYHIAEAIQYRSLDRRFWNV